MSLKQPGVAAMGGSISAEARALCVGLEAATSQITNLITDPHELEPFSLPHLHSWTALHFNRMMGVFKSRVEQEPLILAAQL